MIPSSVRIFVCTEPQDMRRSFDGLVLATQQVLNEHPESGALFCFINKRANRLKVLWWDANGDCLLYKRLHRAVFQLPDSSNPSKPSLRIDGPQLASLIAGVRRESRTRRRRKC